MDNNMPRLARPSRGRWFQGYALGWIILLSSPTQAQVDPNGSLYSAAGLGEIEHFHNSAAQGMGGAGVALPGYVSRSLLNPASIASNLFTRVNLGFEVDRLSVSDGENTTPPIEELRLQAFQASVPIGTKGMAIAVGFQPSSRVGYQSATASTATTIDGVETSIDQFRSGSGGLFRTSVGIAYPIFDGLAVGIQAEGYTGLIEHEQRLAFDNALLESVVYSQSNRFRGTALRFGIRGQFSEILSSRDALTYAGAVRLPTKLDVTSILAVGESLDRDTVGTAFTGNTDLPLELIAGITYAARPGVLASVEYRLQQWSQAQTQVSLPGWSAGSTSQADFSRISAGLSYTPAGLELIRPFFERVTYRFGAYQQIFSGGIVSPGTLTDRGLTFGLGIPTLYVGMRIDWFLAVGRRGTMDDGQLEERYVRTGLTLNVSERWFIRRRLR